MEPPDPAPRKLTIDEALALAIQLQKQQHFAEAEQLYARVLTASREHPDALHYTGCRLTSKDQATKRSHR